MEPMPRKNQRKVNRADTVQRAKGRAAKPRCKLGIIVPVYNEEKTVSKVLEEIEALRGKLPQFELIVVDDGSQDGTPLEVQRWRDVVLLRHNRNLGKGAAIDTALAARNCDLYAVQDADLEYSPSELPKLIRPVASGEADVVFGSRLGTRYYGMSILHYVGNVVLSLVTKILYGANLSDVMTGHKCFNRNVARSLNLRERGFKVETEIAVKIFKRRWRFVEVPISYKRRTEGESKITSKDGVDCLIYLITQLFRSERAS